MTRKQKREHKLANLLRFGYKQGWVVPFHGKVIVASDSPQHFHDKLSAFADLFEAVLAH